MKKEFEKRKKSFKDEGSLSKGAVDVLPILPNQSEFVFPCTLSIGSHSFVVKASLESSQVARGNCPEWRGDERINEGSGEKRRRRKR